MDKSSTPFKSHGSKNNSADSFFNQLGSLLILTSIFFFNFASRIITAPLIPRIESDLNLTHADAGTLVLYDFTGVLHHPDGFRVRILTLQP